MKWICLIFLLTIAYVSSEETSCREGWYGADCGRECSNTCRPLETFPCNKETGKCSEGCKRGFYGPQCKKNCSCTGPCIQNTGDCIGYLTKSTTPPTTKYTTQPIPQPQPEPCQEQNEGELKHLRIVTTVYIVLSALVLLEVVSYEIYRRNWDGIQTSRMPQLAWPPASYFTAMGGEEDPLIARNRDHETVYQELKNAKEKIQELEKKNEYEHNTTLRKLGLCENSSYYLLKESELKKSAFLQCPCLKLDPEKINVTAANLDADGTLTNTPATNHPQHEGSLRHYSGTTTTDPLKLTGSDQYWEVESRIRLKEPIAENEILLDFGFCNHEDMDKQRFTPERKPCCSLRLENCLYHKQICLKVFSDNKNRCDQPTGHKIDAFDGKVVTFKCGFLLHRDKKKITFIEIKNINPFHSASLNLKERIWPMFGLGAQTSTDTNIILICGNDIAWNSGKMQKIKDMT